MGGLPIGKWGIGLFGVTKKVGTLQQKNSLPLPPSPSAVTSFHCLHTCNTDTLHYVTQHNTTTPNYNVFDTATTEIYTE